MNIFIFLLFAVACAILFALLEIQIEGQNGWASKLPTWRINFGQTYRPLTGYHLYLFSFLLLLSHNYLIFQPFSWNYEIGILLFFMTMISLEDFFWFILNPYFGLKKFNSQAVPWHQPWIGPIPANYFTALVIIAILSILYCLTNSLNISTS